MPVREREKQEIESRNTFKQSSCSTKRIQRNRLAKMSNALPNVIDDRRNGYGHGGARIDHHVTRSSLMSVRRRFSRHSSWRYRKTAAIGFPRGGQNETHKSVNIQIPEAYPMRMLGEDQKSINDHDKELESTSYHFFKETGSIPRQSTEDEARSSANRTTESHLFQPYMVPIPQDAIMPICESYICNWFGRGPNERNRLGELPLHEAAFEGDVQSVFMLLRWIQIMDCNNDIFGDHCKQRGNPSSSAASTANDNLSKSRKSVLDSMKDPRGLSALHLATLMGHEAVVKLLVEDGGADIHATCAHFLAKAGVTPLHFAARGGSTSIVRFLLRHGADGGARDSLGRSPMWYAADMGHEKIFRLLLPRDSAKVIAFTVFSQDSFPPLSAGLNYSDGVAKFLWQTSCQHCCMEMPPDICAILVKRIVEQARNDQLERDCLTPIASDRGVQFKSFLQFIREHWGKIYVPDNMDWIKRLSSRSHFGPNGDLDRNDSHGIFQLNFPNEGSQVGWLLHVAIPEGNGAENDHLDEYGLEGVPGWDSDEKKHDVASTVGDDLDYKFAVWTIFRLESRKSPIGIDDLLWAGSDFLRGDGKDSDLLDVGFSTSWLVGVNRYISISTYRLRCPRA